MLQRSQKIHPRIHQTASPSTPSQGPPYVDRSCLQSEENEGRYMEMSMNKYKNIFTNIRWAVLKYSGGRQTLSNRNSYRRNNILIAWGGFPPFHEFMRADLKKNILYIFFWTRQIALTSRPLLQGRAGPEARDWTQDLLNEATVQTTSQSCCKN